MPENRPSSSSNLYWAFVRQPGNVIGLLAFALYQADEIAFIERELTGLASAEAKEDSLDVFRAVAMAQLEGYYRNRAEAALSGHFEYIRGANPPRYEILEATKQARSLVKDAQIEQAIAAVFVLLGKMVGQSERSHHLDLVATNYRLVQISARKGIITFEEIRIGHAVAADRVLTIIDEVEAEIAGE